MNDSRREDKLNNTKTNAIDLSSKKLYQIINQIRED